MATCDVCNGDTSWEEGTTYSAGEFRRLVSKGFEPDGSSIALMTAFGMSRQQAISQWKTGLVQGSTTDWLLCRSCATRATTYSPKPAANKSASPRLAASVSSKKSKPDSQLPKSKESKWWQFWK